ncbi:pyruvate dehydrogenase (acetyl-transferring) E1 component subunit alpha [Saccharomonospora halophila]|uniref:pyruvate dehydrogenase (acetyl-transferring) E1 component subunit alpha n=1 Tax=Saccharomonospora halophila TaxID=129922 RepID=UPI00036473D5|nr:pyruvate dehydrogenase (acetyl-transferring) E1 component subunit alpha [Saccharomonospora halophila]
MTVGTARGDTPDALGESPTEFVQLLSPDGERIEHPGYELELTAAELTDIYRDLVTIRAMDTEALALARQGELAVWASMHGQEAAQIGSARALAAGDMAFPTYREHGVAWSRGVDPVSILGHFRGAYHSGWDPLRSRVQAYSVVIGSHTLHATGYAMGIQRDGTDDAAIAYFGDGATSAGDVNEAFVFAAAHRAPVVFFCQNNQWAISVPVDRQSTVPLHRRAEGFGFPGVRVDGNDVLACLAVTRKALADARAGRGPTLIEAFTYRMGGHTTTDDPTRYRPAAETEEWRSRDPIERVRRHLTASGIADREFVEDVESRAEAVVVDLRHRIRTLPDPDVAEIWEYAYATGHPRVDTERTEYADYLESFEDGQW